MLAFGHTAGLPPDTDTAWGAQATITAHGTLHVPADRTDLVGPRAAQLRAHLDNHVRAAWRDRAIELHRAGLLRPGHDGEILLYRDATVVIKAATRPTDQAVHVCAYLTTALQPG
jgi:hypothetical protein